MKTEKDAYGWIQWGGPRPNDIVGYRLPPAATKEGAALGANAAQVSGDHYASRAIQPWDYIVANNLGYLEGNVVKYVTRWKDKGGLVDLQKARHYIDKLIEGAAWSK